MLPTRIAELLQPFLQETSSQPPAANDKLYSDISTYIDLLQHWNSRINLTAIRTEEEIVTRHFGESLFAARHLFPKPYPVTSSVPPVSPVVKALDSLPPEAARFQQPLLATPRLADLGSGAGFPGIPIKLWAPEIHLTLIESNHKKSTFLREVARTLTLTNIDIQTGRAESLLHTYDVLTLRAVEHFSTILPQAARLTAPTGRLALLIGSSQLDEARQLLPDFHSTTTLPVPSSNSRLLLIATRKSSQ